MPQTKKHKHRNSHENRTLSRWLCSIRRRHLLCPRLRVPVLVNHALIVDTTWPSFGRVPSIYSVRWPRDGCYSIFTSTGHAKSWGTALGRPRVSDVAQTSAYGLDVHRMGTCDNPWMTNEHVDDRWASTNDVPRSSPGRPHIAHCE